MSKKNKSPNKSPEEGRRKVLKSTLAGGAIVSTSILPDKWEQPMLGSIVLPSHAETSSVAGDGDSGDGTTNTTTTTTTTTMQPNTSTTTTTTTMAPNTTTTTTTTTMAPNVVTNVIMNVTTSFLFNSEKIV